MANPENIENVDVPEMPDIDDLENNDLDARLSALEDAERAINSAYSTGKAERARITQMAQLDAAEAVAMAGIAMEADEVADEAMRITVMAEKSGNRENAKAARKKEREARKKANVRKFWGWFCGLVVVACVALWLCNVLAPIGIKSPLSCYKEAVETVEAPVAEQEAPSEAEPAAAEESPAE